VAVAVARTDLEKKAAKPSGNSRSSLSAREMDMSIEKYFSGLALYGDDFTVEEIAAWYATEENGYFNLVESVFFKDQEYVYEYAAANEHYGYRHIRSRQFRRALAFGCARGDDVAPIAGNVDEFVAIEPAEKWWHSSIGGKPANYIKPCMSGEIPYAANEFDLTICLGVLHHIPNVTHVISEIARVSAPGALLLLREPICTMGDWRKQRVGLTQNERGFPLQWLESTLRNAGFSIRKRALYAFPLTPRLARVFGLLPFNNNFFVILDQLFSCLTSWNYRYHRDTLFRKLAPSNVFYVLEKTAV
jgi:SAM-dependent methyltransferase